MGIQVEFNPDLALRNYSEFQAGRRAEEECLPQNLQAGQTYKFLKKEARNYWLQGELPLLETKGNAELSKPLASIIILSATHFLLNGEVCTKGEYMVTEVFTDNQIHFNSYAKIKPPTKINKIFICCSKRFYDRVNPIKEQLEQKGFTITLPNSFDDPGHEARLKAQSATEHARFKAQMFTEQEKKINHCDAVLVLNFAKDDQPNYIGGATFLEMYKAFELNKVIYLYNPIPLGMLEDEILGFSPIVINGNLDLVT